MNKIILHLNQINNILVTIIYDTIPTLKPMFDKFSHALLLLGFKESKSEYSIFVCGSQGNFCASMC